MASILHGIRKGSTTHKTVDIVRVGGTFERNPTNISDVSSGVSWNVDVTTADALANDQGNQYLNFNVSGNGTAWIVGGDHGSGINTPTVVNAQPGAEIRYVDHFNTLDILTHLVTGVAVSDNVPLTPVFTPCGVSASIDSISNDTGDPSDFTTFDQQVAVSGRFLGSALDIAVNGTNYDLTSPELAIEFDQVDGFQWTLDLTGVTLGHGSYLVEVTASDDALQTASVAETIIIECVTTQFELINNPRAQCASVGNAFACRSKRIWHSGTRLSARKIGSSNIIYVDEAFNGDDRSWIPSVTCLMHSHMSTIWALPMLRSTWPEEPIHGGILSVQQMLRVSRQV